MDSYRNSQKRYYDDNAVYFITVKTDQDLLFFTEPIFCNLLIEEIKICKKLKEFKLYGFSIIYDHINLLLQPGSKYNISKVMQSLKKESSRDINYLINHAVDDIPECRLRGKQYSPQYDKEYNVPNLSYYRNKFVKKYNMRVMSKFRWQKSFYDHAIRDEKDFEIKYIYTVYNFQKHGLPEDWRYTSLNYKDLIDEILI